MLRCVAFSHKVSQLKVLFHILRCQIFKWFIQLFHLNKVWFIEKQKMINILSQADCICHCGLLMNEFVSFIVRWYVQYCVSELHTFNSKDFIGWWIYSILSAHFKLSSWSSEMLPVYWIRNKLYEHSRQI